MVSNNSIDSDDHRLNKDLAPATHENPSKNLDFMATKVFVEEDEVDDGSEGGKEKPKTPALLEKEKEVDNKEALIPSNGLPPRTSTSELDVPIPKKVCIRVKRIEMTKTELEHLTNQGLLELRDGNLILKCPVQTLNVDGAEFQMSSDGEDDEPPEKMTAASRTDFDDAS